MSSPPVSSTPSARRTASASMARSVVAGATMGRPHAAMTACPYRSDKLTERSLNSTPRSSKLGEIKISGRCLMPYIKGEGWACQGEIHSRRTF
jgi:hypothetical protein